MEIRGRKCNPTNVLRFSKTGTGLGKATPDPLLCHRVRKCATLCLLYVLLINGLNSVLAERGEFIFFHYSLIKSDAEWERLKKFRLLLTNGYDTFSHEKVAALHKVGCRLFFYFWFNGFYEWEAKQPMPDGNWRREILEKHRDWLLNPNQPEKGGGAVNPAYFFDFTKARLRQFLARIISERCWHTGYDGVFFDYVGSYALPPAILKRHQQQYPNISYDAASALFLKGIKAVEPSILIFTNQAYRSARDLLPFTDIDATESISTSHLWGKEITIFSEGEGLLKTSETFYRPWDGAHGIKAHYTDILEKVHRFNPNVRFLTINYVKAFWEPTGKTVAHGGRKYIVCRKRPDRAAIFYGYVAAKLFGLDSYSSDWYDLGSYDDELFLIDLGRTKGIGPDERDGIVVRYYENGFVALTRNNKGGVFDVSSAHIPAEMRGLWDVYERCFVPDFPKQRCITINPILYPISNSTYPSGRVYVYLR